MQLYRPPPGPQSLCVSITSLRRPPPRLNVTTAAAGPLNADAAISTRALQLTFGGGGSRKQVRTAVASPTPARPLP
jgi:hypothetical protein